MRYWNQPEYEEIPYPTNVKDPDSDFAVYGNVRRTGRGLCSVCVVIDRLCLTPFSLEECHDLSVSVGANQEIGTDMQSLVPAVAERFGLRLQTADDLTQLIECLRSGGAAIVNTGGNQGAYTGTFSNGGPTS